MAREQTVYSAVYFPHSMPINRAFCYGAYMSQSILTRSEIVSSESEALILVDAEDCPIGTRDKATCHDGNGLLHRAFSLFVFNQAGQLLLQQRDASKRLWPEYWSNSCCSHPRSGESMVTAVQRRCQQELGFFTRFEYLYKFEYQAAYREQGKTIGSEHELCSVYIGRHDGALDINRSEIQAYQWLPVEDVATQLAAHPNAYTPWFKLEWERITQDYAAVLDALLQDPAR